MKVLFLDHDGVICLSDEWGGRFKKKGFDNPMVDTGKFKKAASGKVNGVGTFGKGKLG